MKARQPVNQVIFYYQPRLAVRNGLENETGSVMRSLHYFNCQIIGWPHPLSVTQALQVGETSRGVASQAAGEMESELCK